jgi:hypothetical protein
MLTNGLKSSTERKKILTQTLKNNLLKNMRKELCTPK